MTNGMKLDEYAERKSRNSCARIGPGACAIFRIAGPERPVDCRARDLESVLLPHVGSNRYCRQGPKRQFTSRKFKFKLGRAAAAPAAGPAVPAPARRRRCQSSNFECRGPGPGVAQFTEPESGLRRRRGCPAAPVVSVTPGPGPGPALPLSEP